MHYKTTPDGLIMHDMETVGKAVSAAEHTYMISKLKSENEVLRRALLWLKTRAECEDGFFAKKIVEVCTDALPNHVISESHENPRKP